MLFSQKIVKIKFQNPLPNYFLYGIIISARVMMRVVGQSSAKLRTNVYILERSRTMTKLDAFAREQLKETVPSFNIGDTIRIHNKIKEGTRERIQLFEGTVIARRGSGISETFTVRRVSYGCGVEKTFPLHSPHVEKVEVIRRGKVRRAKLYYLRDRVGKSSKVKELI